MAQSLLYKRKLEPIKKDNIINKINKIGKKQRYIKLKNQK